MKTKEAPSQELGEDGAADALGALGLKELAGKES